MAYAYTYTTLWHHQTHLFSEIETLRSQISPTQRQLQRTQDLLTNENLKRNDRRKANWTVTLNRRHLANLDKQLKAQMQGLLVCQAQLGRMHMEASRGNFGWNGTQGFVQLQPSRPLSTDSGFWEPALYAQPFGLDLDQKDKDDRHLFSHEPFTPIPVVGTRSDSSALNPTVASPMTRVPASETKKRYSEAAISLIEGRLRRRKSFQEGRASDKGEEAADVDVDVAVESVKRKRESSEVRGLPWPGSPR